MAESDELLSSEDVGDLVTGRPLLIQMWRWAWQEFVVNKKPRCLNSARHAVYRNEAGRTCPLGWALAVEVQLSPWENMTQIGKLMHARPDVRQCFRGIRVGVLNDFQACHDCNDYAHLDPHRIHPVHIALLLKKFAVKWQLDITDKL